MIARVTIPGLTLLATTMVALVQMAAPAMAQPVPSYLPTRDVAVTYHVRSRDAGDQDVRARWSANLGRARIEGGPGVLLVDPSARRATMVMEQQRIAMDLPGDGVAFLPDPGTRFTRKGGDTVAGLACTNWNATGTAGSGEACITADGVILRGHGRDRHGREGSIEATGVDYAAQPPGLFQVPSGVVKLQLPAGLKLDAQAFRR